MTPCTIDYEHANVYAMRVSKLNYLSAPTASVGSYINNLQNLLARNEKVRKTPENDPLENAEAPSMKGLFSTRLPRATVYEDRTVTLRLT
jgi:hypothetical protein